MSQMQVQFWTIIVTIAVIAVLWVLWRIFGGDDAPSCAGCGCLLVVVAVLVIGGIAIIL